MVVSFGMHCPRKLRHQTVYSHLKRDINKARRNFKEPLLQTVLSSEVYIVYFVLICTLYELSFVFYMNCHTLIVYGGNYVSHLWTFTSENGFCVFRVFYVLKLRVHVHRATWENSQWLNDLPCINILEKKCTFVHVMYRGATFVYIININSRCFPWWVLRHICDVNIDIRVLCIMKCPNIYMHDLTIFILYMQSGNSCLPVNVICWL